MPFEELPTTPTAEELLDKAFSRAARTGRAKEGVDGQLSMLQTAGNILSDNLMNIVEQWPDFDLLHPFHVEIAGTLVDVDAVRMSLSEVHWAGEKTGQLLGEYQGKMRKASTEDARKHRKQAFARMASVVEEVGDDLLHLGNVRNELRQLPAIDPTEPTIVVAGYPNVGKTSFVNEVTRARNKTASYPFTTTGIMIGHLERSHLRYQLIDTPGLLDRPAADRNAIETQAVSAVTHLADCLLVFVDPSGRCGYPLEDQLALRDQLAETFGDIPVLTIGTKADESTAVDADYHMSVETGENVEAVVEAAIDATGYEPKLPYEME